MSLAIDVDLVSAVLLADGWHVVDDESFTMDAYEYLWYANDEIRRRSEPMVLHGGGGSGICATGFEFKEGTALVRGPLTAILAVKQELAP